MKELRMRLPDKAIQDAIYLKKVLEHPNRAITVAASLDLTAQIIRHIINGGTVIMNHDDACKERQITIGN